MSARGTIFIPTRQEFRAGIEEFNRRDRRAYVYYVALEALELGWGDPVRMSRAIGVLLEIWNSAFYRYGAFDLPALTRCVADRLPALKALRFRTTQSLNEEDEPMIRDLFGEFTKALRGGKGGTRESTVATAKALHLLAPGFFPLWDNAIASAYGHTLMWVGDYLVFCQQMKQLAEAVEDYVDAPDECTLLKRLDEFNYAVSTGRWVSLSGAGTDRE
jgi:hypothetical protein